MRSVAPLFLASVVSACSALPAIFSVGQNPQDVFLQDVASQRSHVPLDGNIGNYRVRGLFLGDQNGCQRVALEWTDIRRTTQHLVCAGNIARLDTEPVPAMPRSPDIDRIRQSVARSAWASGTLARGRFENYAIEAIAVGPADSNGCRRISDRVLYEGALVESRQVLVCQ